MRRASSTARGCAKKAAFTSVRKNPGAVALAAIPFSPSSTARARINELVLAALDMAAASRASAANGIWPLPSCVTPSWLSSMTANLFRETH